MSDSRQPSSLVPSVQRHDDGQIRFHLLPLQDDIDIGQLTALEQDGGVDAEFRLFLDAQLEAGDVFVDFAPGYGFVLLSAASHAQEPRVVAAINDESAAQAIAENARQNAVAIEICSVQEGTDTILTTAADPAYGAARRLFVHVSASALIEGVVSPARLAQAVGLTAVLVRFEGETLAAQTAMLTRAFSPLGLRLHALVDTDSGPSLLEAEQAPPSTALIAVPIAVEPERVSVYDTTARVGTAFNLIAQFCRTGYGITGANLIKALGDMGADVSYFPLGAVDRSIAEVPRLDEYLERQAAFDDRAPSVRLSQEFDLALHVGRGPRVGFPIFEANRFTRRERHHLAHHEHLIVCTEWARKVLRENRIEVPVSLVPLGVDRSIFHEDVAATAMTDDTLFVQVGKIEPRKGQLDLLHAFEAAFTPADAVRLRLYCHNPFLGTSELDTLLGAFRRSPMTSRIELITTPLPTQHHVATAMMAADCGVFCSRAEGWNLEALEMLSLGKPVIATDYSGHTEFLTAANARLVPVSSRESYGEGTWGGFGANEKEALVTHLRDLHEARRGGRLPVNRAGIETAVRYSWMYAAEQLLAAVQASMGT